MSEKHYPYLGGNFDRIVFDGDGSVWVPAKAKRETVSYEEGYADGFDRGQEAIVQQIAGIIDNEWCGNGEKVKDIMGLVDDFWKERES